MGKTKVIQLSDSQRQALEDGYRNGKSHAFRERCQMILLKSGNRTSAEIARFFKCHRITVHEWVKRFEAEGIDEFENASGARTAGETSGGNRSGRGASGGGSITSAHQSGQSRVGNRAAETVFDDDAQTVSKKTIAASNELEND